MATTGAEKHEGESRMPPLPDSTDLDALWEYLELGINRVLDEPDISLDVQSYSGFYTAIHDYTTCARGLPKSMKGAGPQRSIHTLGEDLYHRLNKCLGQYTHELALRSQSHKDEYLLQFYIEEWQRYSEASKLINRLFQYFNRHWLKREVDEAKSVPWDVYTICLIHWHDGFFKEVSGDLFRVIRTLPDTCRGGEIIEPHEIQAIISDIVLKRPLNARETGTHSSKRIEELSDRLRGLLHSCLGVDYEEFSRLMADLHTGSHAQKVGSLKLD